MRGTQAPSGLRADRERRSRHRPPTEGAERRPTEEPHRLRPARRWPGPRTGSARWEAPERLRRRTLRGWWSRPGHRPSRIPTAGGFAQPGPGRSTDSIGGRRRRRTPRRPGPDGVPISGTPSTPVATAGVAGRSTMCQEPLDWQPPQGRARLRSPARPRRRAPSTGLRRDGRGARATVCHRLASATRPDACTEQAFGSTTPLPFRGPGRGWAASVCHGLYPARDPGRNGPAGDIPLTRGWQVRMMRMWSTIGISRSSRHSRRTPGRPMQTSGGGWGCRHPRFTNGCASWRRRGSSGAIAR